MTQTELEVYGIAHLIRDYAYAYQDEREVTSADMQVVMKGKECKILVVFHSISGFPYKKDMQEMNYDAAVFLDWE